MEVPEVMVYLAAMACPGSRRIPSLLTLFPLSCWDPIPVLAMDETPSSDPGAAKGKLPANLRPLLPAIDPNESSSSSPSPLSGPSGLTKKPAPTTSACSSCRKRKAKCSGHRPICRRCTRLTLPCQYDTDEEGETAGQATKRRFTDILHRMGAHESVYSALRSRDDKDVTAILKRIRQGDDVDTVARHLSFGDVLLQVSLVPETRYRYVFPIMTEMPEALNTPGNPYLKSLLYEWTMASEEVESGDVVAPAITDGTVTTEDIESPGNDPYLKPWHAADIVDVNLSIASPSKWTNACSDDELMRHLIGRYLILEYSAHAYFQKEYFLEDMLKMRDRLCSPLLVNTVLAVACFHEPGLSNRAEWWNPSSLSYQFLAEAKRLWEVEQDVDRLTTIQAGIMLNVALSLCGLDKPGWDYTEHAMAMATRLGLFDGTHVHQFKSDRMRDAAVFTAWAVFSWTAEVSFAFHRLPAIPDPPSTPLPNVAENPQWYGELWVRYPNSNAQYAFRYGHIFKALAELMVILNDASKFLFSDPPRPTITALAGICARFKQWYLDLPEPLLPRNIALPAQLRLQYVHPSQTQPTPH
ncbi:nitrogen assimilation transcription factor nirA [Podospora conica]|nr:nitrogen assimilation transcription factor nirA [Schizothecium conicum]